MVGQDNVAWLICEISEYANAATLCVKGAGLHSTGNHVITGWYMMMSLA